MKMDEFMKEFDSILYYNRKEFNKKSMEEDAYKLGKEDVIKNMLQDGIDIESISKWTKVSLEEIEKLQENLEK